MPPIREHETDAFELLTGQCGYLATRIGTVITELAGDCSPSPQSQLNVAGHRALQFLSRQLTEELRLDGAVNGIFRKYAEHPPVWDCRDAQSLYGRLSEQQQKTLTALTTNTGLRWWIFANATDEGLDASVIPDCEVQMETGRSAAAALLDLDAFIRGWTHEEAAELQQRAAEKLIHCFEDSPETVPEGQVQYDYNAAKRDLRYVTIDLEAADMNPQRADFEKFLKSRVEASRTSDSPDPVRDLWKAFLLEADQRFPWSPPQIAPRRVSLKPSADAVLRRAVRVLSMLGELHKAGYQRIRGTPMLSPSGCHWRLCLTHVGNVELDGFTIRDFDMEAKTVAVYSTGQEANFFGWDDAQHASARELAKLFLERFPLIAEQGVGRDWAYAGWLTEVISRAENGGDDALLYLIADFPVDREQLRLWQPPRA